MSVPVPSRVSLSLPSCPCPFPRVSVPPRVSGVAWPGLTPPFPLVSRQKSRFPAEGEHKLDSLPVLAMSALELPNIQVWTRMGGDRDP